MEITVFVKQILPVVSVSNGKYQKGGFVGETGGQYSKDICFQLFGDKKLAKCPQVGQQVNVAFDLTSHEYNGRWYTEVDAFDIKPVGCQVATGQPQTQYATQGNQVVCPNQGAVVNGQRPQFSQMQGQPQQPTSDPVPF